MGSHCISSWSLLIFLLSFIGQANTKFADKIWSWILVHGPGFYSFPAVAVVASLTTITVP